MGNDVKQQLNWIESQIKLLQYGDNLKGNPIIVRFSNGIQGVLEITKSDIKTIARTYQTTSSMRRKTY